MYIIYKEYPPHLCANIFLKENILPGRFCVNIINFTTIRHKIYIYNSRSLRYTTVRVPFHFHTLQLDMDTLHR